MENWRLSRIEEELGKLKLDLVSPSDAMSDDTRGKYFTANMETGAKVGGDASRLCSADDDILSNIVIRPAYKASRTSSRKAEASKAIRLIKEKYDSPNAVTKMTPEAEDGSNSGQTRSANLEATIQAASQNHAKQCSTTDVLSGMAPLTSEMLPPPSVCITSNDTVGEFLPFSGRKPPNEFDSFSPVADRPRLHSTGNHWSSRPGPPTAAKPSSSQLPGPSYEPSAEGNWAVGSLEVNHRPSNLNASVGSSGQTTKIFHNYCLSSSDKMSPASMTLPSDFKNSSFIQNHNNVYMDRWPQEAGETMRYNPPDLVTKEDWSNGSSAPLPGFQTSEPSRNFISIENQMIPYPTSSSNCYAHFGTMRTQQMTSPGEARGECFPPNGSCLADEDRLQVEMFYRSHKSRIFVSRCEANLYFGSARRHSVVLPSNKRVPGHLPHELSAENWIFVKCGIPVLVLDTGESRRQRRLHIILAERGSGFVLWRDSVDHLTNYTGSGNIGFHTMHLSKDHTKLAGLYFADSLSASDFFDYLSNLTSNPDDPLLDLSKGGRKKKDRKHGAASSCTKKKEKRKPVKPEDISLPCCFSHVTKLDRNDGLNIIYQSDQAVMDRPKDSQLENDDSLYVKTSPLS